MAAQSPTQSQSEGYIDAKWLVAFVVMGGVLLLVAESPKYGEVASSLAVVIAIGFWTHSYDKMRAEINSLFGTNY